MASTYTPIQTYTLGSNQATVTFSSIPSTYTDLVLINNGTLSGDDYGYYCRFNSDTGTNYSWTYINGNGSSAGSARASNYNLADLGLQDDSATMNITQFMNYSNTTTYKTYLNRAGVPSLHTRTTVGLWRSTSAISQIDLFVSGQTFQTGSTFTLYGIKAA